MVVAGIDQLLEKLKKSNELLELILKVDISILSIYETISLENRAIRFVSSCQVVSKRFPKGFCKTQWKKRMSGPFLVNL